MKSTNQSTDKHNTTITKESALSKWENLTIQNRFLFAKVMGQKEYCLPLLQRLFPKLHITDIRYVESEKTIEGSIDSKSVRLDVYVQDSESRAFTLEMQVDDRGNLPMRSRYYSSMMDEDLLGVGQDYEEILPAYVIFICPFDLFHKGLHRYTFTNTCTEDPSVSLGDGSVKIFLNTNGTASDVSPEILSFLNYVNGNLSLKDEYIKSLDLAVQKAKKNANWRREFMKYEMEMRHERKMARAEGLAEGRAEGLATGLAEGRAEGLATGLAEGRAEGRAEGISMGEKLLMIRMISSKIQKGKDLLTIAADLEESVSSIKPIYDLLITKPKASPEEILEFFASLPQR